MTLAGSTSREQIRRLRVRRVAMAVVGSALSAVTLAGVNTWTTTWPPGGGQGVIVDPTSGAVYGGSGYLLKSMDDGTTWATVCPSVPYAVPLAAKDEVLYAVAESTLYQSLDGGGQCNVLSSDPGTHNSYVLSYSLLIDPFDPNTLYRNEVLSVPRIGMPYHLSVLTRSVDRGLTWTDIGQGPGFGLVTALTADPAHRGTLYAGTVGNLPALGPNALYKSTDAGSTWALLNDGAVVGALAVDPFTPSTLYASGAQVIQASGGTFRSVDGGATFQTVNASRALQIVVDPKHRGRIYIATYDAGVLESVDGGATWAAINAGLPDLRVYSLALDPTGTILFAWTYGGIFQYQTEDLTELRLYPGRVFTVSLEATDQRSGRTGPGLAIPGSAIFGYFSLPAITGNPGNPEVFVKMLDGTAINGEYWFFYGGLTDLEYTLTVIDEATGRSRTYSKAAGDECGGSDTAAFAP